MKNWKKAAGLYAAYKVGQASRREAPREAPRGGGSGSRAGLIAYAVLAIALAYLLYRWGF